LLEVLQEKSIQASAAAAEVLVAAKALAARPLAARALPALKPNQISPPPSTVIEMACGSIGTSR
jgi:hypothetical protein